MFLTTLMKVIGTFTVIIRQKSLCLTIIFSIEMHQSSIAQYEWPHGSYWVNEHPKLKAQLQAAAQA